MHDGVHFFVFFLSDKMGQLQIAMWKKRSKRLGM